MQHLQAQASYTRIQKQVEGNEVAFPGKSCKHVESLCGHPGIGFGGTFQNMSNHVGIVEALLWYLQGLDKKASTGQETFASKFTISWSPINMVKIIQV